MPRRRLVLFLSVVLIAGAVAAGLFYKRAPEPSAAPAPAGTVAAASPVAARDLPSAEVYTYEVCNGKSRRVAGGDMPAPAADAAPKFSATPCSLGTDNIIPAGNDVQGRINDILKKHTGVVPGGDQDKKAPPAAPAP